MDIKARCPLCGTEDTKILKVFSAEEAARHIRAKGSDEEILYIAQYIEDTIWKQKEATIVVCRNCRLEFALPFVAGDSFLYNILYDTSYLHNNFWKWDFKIALNVLQQRVKKDSKILDIGAGSGHFISKVATTVTLPKFCYAIEYSDTCREEISKLHINTYKNLSGISDKKSFFDVVCFFQSLEHMDDLKNKLCEIDTLTGEKGLIIISVPNNLQRSFYDKYGIYEDVPPTHISRFSPETFKKIAEHMKWELINHAYEPSQALSRITRFIFFATAKEQNFQKIKLKTKQFPSFIRKLVKGSYAAVFCIRNIITIARLLLNQKLGTSQIAVFEKNKHNPAAHDVARELSVAKDPGIVAAALKIQIHI